jgi:protoporphyrinogen oxidase
MQQKKAIIIGAGPAGLTAAYELTQRTSIKPIVLEKSGELGGLSRTVNFNGNRIDIGGHRFFSKSDRVMEWWRSILPIIAYSDDQKNAVSKMYKKASADLDQESQSDNVMLVRPRVSRIYFRRTFFDYPLQFTPQTVRKLGTISTAKIGASYLKSVIFPIKKEKNLEDFFINRFGSQLYHTFFKSYTEKVWGVPCTEISPEWGAQRIKGISIAKTLQHFCKQILPKTKSDIRQKAVETSLIEQFLYPKFGPGQMWQQVAQKVEEAGGVIIQQQSVVKLEQEDGRISRVVAENKQTGQQTAYDTDYVFSSMPVKELVDTFAWSVPHEVARIAQGLMYRDFMTIGILLKRLKINEKQGMIPDNWIYIQEPDVLVGRVQIFNNWSPYMVANPEHIWIGLEYFLNETDELWAQSECDLIQLGIDEMVKLDFIDRADVVDAMVLKVEKAYPAYFGTYDRFKEIQEYTDRFANLFLVGRNGMHKYNNQDHSMVTAMKVVDGLVVGSVDKQMIWSVNTEKDYHESKQAS